MQRVSVDRCGPADTAPGYKVDMPACQLTPSSRSLSSTGAWHPAARTLMPVTHGVPCAVPCLLRACSFSSRGYYLDGSAIFGSLVLLVILLALTFERILGLDRFINQAIM